MRRRSCIVPSPFPLAQPTLTARANGLTSILLSAQISRADVKLLRYEFAPSINGPWSELIRTASFVASHDNLSPGQVVFYRVRVQFLTGGLSPYSATISQSTDASLKSAAITSTTSSATLSTVGSPAPQFIFNEVWATTTSSGFPTGTVYDTNYNSSGDPGSVKNVVNSVTFPPTGGNVALFDQTPPDRAARHDMVVYDGPEGHLARGVRYWLSFAFMLTGDWAAHPEITGFFNIPFQLHPDDSGGLSGPLAQPMVNLELTNGPGGAFQWIITGYTKNQAQHRFAQYPFPDGTGNTGTIALGVWHGFVLDITICSLPDGSDGRIDIYGARYPNPFPSTPQIQDRGLNEYLDDILSPYPSFGVYHGEGGSSSQAPLTGRHQIYWGPWKYARASAGANLANMKLW